MTVQDAQLPSLECTQQAIKVGDVGKVPMTMLASACASWMEETCEIWAPRTGLAVAASVLTALMSPDMIRGHEVIHCWLHNFH
jgi:hypothetical protein